MNRCLFYKKHQDTYQFLTTVCVTDYHELGVSNTNLFSHSCGGRKSRMGGQGCSRGESIPLPFLASRSHLCSLAHGPAPTFMPSRAASSHLSPLLRSHPLFLILTPPPSYEDPESSRLLFQAQGFNVNHTYQVPLAMEGSVFTGPGGEGVDNF